MAFQLKNDNRLVLEKVVSVYFVWIFKDMFFLKWASRKNEIIEKTEKLRLFEKYFIFPLKTYRVHGFYTIGQYGTSKI